MGRGGGLVHNTQTNKQTMNLMDIVFEMRLSELDDDDKIIMLEIRNTF